MRSFRNHGWEHYDKVQAIIPGNRARGSHAYRATTASHPPTEPDQTAAGPSTSIAPLPPTSISEADHDKLFIHPAENRFLEEVELSSAGDGNMGLDNSLIQPTSFTSRSSKRSFAEMSSESSVPPSQDMSAFSGQSDPVSKKSKTRALPSLGQGTGKRTSARPAAVRPANRSFTQATAVVGMQGSINRLTDIFEKSMGPPQDPLVERKTRALGLMQTRDDGLSVPDKVKLISNFDQHPMMIDTYLGLLDDELRQAWISSVVLKD